MLILTAAALLLIAAVNGVLLWNVARNRAGAPEAELLLSERELLIQQSWREESSGRFLQLRYQYLRGTGNGESWQANPWLDKAKLKALGYRLEEDGSNQSDIKNFPRFTQKSVFLVLELQGKCYQQVLAQAVAQMESLRLDGKPEELRRAAERLQQVREEDSRLFVVDAGKDAEQLRQLYPDREQYAIVPGYVRVWWYTPWQDEPGQEKRPKLSTYLSLAHDRIFVPLDFASVVGGGGAQKPGQTQEESALPKFQLRLAFGQLLEPWIKDMQAGQTVP